MGCAGGKEKEVSAEFFLHHPNGPAIESALTELAANTQDQKLSAELQLTLDAAGVTDHSLSRPSDYDLPVCAGPRGCAVAWLPLAHSNFPPDEDDYFRQSGHGHSRTTASNTVGSCYN